MAGRSRVTLLGDAAAPFGGKLPAGCAALRGATLGAGATRMREESWSMTAVPPALPAGHCRGDDGERLSLCTGRGRSA